MTADDKKARRDLIKERQEARAARIAQGYATYWLTRSKRDGELSPHVDIWTRRPERVRFDDGDSFWMAAHPDGTGAHYGRWTTQQCLFEIRTYPEDDRQCIRVGNEIEESMQERQAS